ncbi:hypothetical protein MKW94_001557 [Papaver nudicaule]|uniref:Uncharacterized protein n=1 Tax=Papaver nudicaule TaxID=74823 RepID=A0AA42B421_PAPNU|nr:hypothetical protein [Papaver nudicaule]
MKKKHNNKGKVYPSPSSSPQSPGSSYDFGPHRDALSVFKVLPLTILTLASVLSLEDREVLAYLITRSIITTTNPADDSRNNKKKKKKQHKSPVFECGCFECYTSYWVRWDLSPNRQLIHQAIEAFEEHLTNLELVKTSTTSGKKKKRADNKMGSRTKGKESVSCTQSPALLPVKSLFHADDLLGFGNEEEEGEEGKEGSFMEELISTSSGEAETGEMVVVVMKNSEEQEYKGLVRKVLPDVLGLFNSRLWSLIWSPNV